MKKFKFPSLLLGLALAVMCAFAFTPHPAVNDSKFNTQYYYHGPDQNINNLKVSGNWNTTNASCGVSGLSVCGISGSSTRSVFDANLQSFTSQSQMLSAANLKKP